MFGSLLPPGRPKAKTPLGGSKLQAQRGGFTAIQEHYCE